MRSVLLVHLHSGHGGVVHVVVPLVVVIGGPDFLWVGLIGIDVDHPSKKVRKELTTGGVAGFLCGDRAEQAELREGAEILGLLSGRSLAEIDVLMPAGDAQRNAVVELVLGCGDAIGVHRSYELVAAVGGLLV